MSLALFPCLTVEVQEVGGMVLKSKLPPPINSLTKDMQGIAIKADGYTADIIM